MQAHPEPLSAQDVMSLSAGPCPHNNVDKTNVWVVLRRNEERAKAATARTAKAAVLGWRPRNCLLWKFDNLIRATPMEVFYGPRLWNCFYDAFRPASLA